MLAALLIFGTCLPASAYSWTYTNSSGKVIHETDTDLAEVRNTIYNYLDDHTELNKAAICGIMGNIWAECCFNVNETYGSYHGLCQWGGSRWSACQSYCSKNGYNYNSVNGQLAFLVYELKNNYSGTYNSMLKVPNTTDGVYQAENIFRVNYEGCGTQAKARRQAAAITFWHNIKPEKTADVNKVSKPAVTDKNISELQSAMSEAVVNIVFEIIELTIIQSVYSVSTAPIKL